MRNARTQRNKTESGWWADYGHFIRMTDYDEEERVLSIRKFGDDGVLFLEECDQNFCISMSKESARKALQEALDWLGE
jgi:hypothetical protein